MFEMGEHLLPSLVPWQMHTYSCLEVAHNTQGLTRMCGSFIQVIPQDPDQPKKSAFIIILFTPQIKKLSLRLEL